MVFVQVPQFILDDMIEAGRGGHCNIICTQPRRIAVSITFIMQYCQAISSRTLNN